jgi:lactate permease
MVTAGKLGFGQSLIAASNSAGGVMGNMISLRTIAVAAALRHSIFLASLVGVEVMLYAYIGHMQ